MEKIIDTRLLIQDKIHIVTLISGGHIWMIREIAQNFENRVDTEEWINFLVFFSGRCLLIQKQVCKIPCLLHLLFNEKSED
jgi:hypothetical protein